ncbi:MAG: hypothetical protein Q9215_004370 [Flavoplaca cf. flavocitrina]
MVERSEICSLPEGVTQRRLLQVLAQVLSQTLSDQQSDVARNIGKESLPRSQFHRNEEERRLADRIPLGHLLRRVYEIAAPHALYSQRSWSSQMTKLCQIEDEHTKGMQRFLSALRFFQQPRLFSLELMLIEAAQYIDLLGRAESAIFPSDVMRIKKGKYQDLIPVIWTDEYMESVIVHIGEAKLSLLVWQVGYDCALQDLPASGGGPRKERLNGQQISNSGSEVSCDQGSRENAAGNNVMQYSSTALSKFIKHILHHPAVLRAVQYVRRALMTPKFSSTVPKNGFQLVFLSDYLRLVRGT